MELLNKLSLSCCSFTKTMSQSKFVRISRRLWYMGQAMNRHEHYNSVRVSVAVQEFDEWLHMVITYFLKYRSPTFGLHMVTARFILE